MPRWPVPAAAILLLTLAASPPSLLTVNSRTTCAGRVACHYLTPPNPATYLAVRVSGDAAPLLTLATLFRKGLLRTLLCTTICTHTTWHTHILHTATSHTHLPSQDTAFVHTFSHTYSQHIHTLNPAPSSVLLVLLSWFKPSIHCLSLFSMPTFHVFSSPCLPPLSLTLFSRGWLHTHGAGSPFFTACTPAHLAYFPFCHTQPCHLLPSTTLHLPFVHIPFCLTLWLL